MVTMPIFLALTYNSYRGLFKYKSLIFSQTKNFLRKSSGFSILEILVALTLISVVFSLANFSGQSQRKKLEIAIEDIERAIRFSRNEAVVTNKIIRLKFDLAKSPISYVVEASDNSNLLLPEYIDEERLGIEERKNRDAKVGRAEQAFIPVAEFQNNIRELNEDIKIAGIATSLTKDLITDGTASVYFYPTGHQDLSLIILQTYEELVTLEAESVRERFNIDYHPLNDFIEETYADVVFDQTKGLFNQWSSSNQ